MTTVELRIEPEPTPEERAAIAAALESAEGRDAAFPAWARAELDDELGAEPGA